MVSKSSDPFPQMMLPAGIPKAREAASRTIFEDGSG